MPRALTGCEQSKQECDDHNKRSIHIGSAPRAVASAASSNCARSLPLAAPYWVSTASGASSTAARLLRIETRRASESFDILAVFLRRATRSEERRVGKEGRARASQYD